MFCPKNDDHQEDTVAMTHTNTWHSPLLGPLFVHGNQNHPHLTTHFGHDGTILAVLAVSSTRALPRSHSSVGWIDNNTLPKLQGKTCIKSCRHAISSGKGVFRASEVDCASFQRTSNVLFFFNGGESVARYAQLSDSLPRVRRTPPGLPAVKLQSIYRSMFNNRLCGSKTQYWTCLTLCRSSASRCIRCWQMETWGVKTAEIKTKKL